MKLEINAITSNSTLKKPKLYEKQTRKEIFMHFH